MGWNKARWAAGVINASSGGASEGLDSSDPHWTCLPIMLLSASKTASCGTVEVGSAVESHLGSSWRLH